MIESEKSIWFVNENMLKIEIIKVIISPISKSEDIVRAMHLSNPLQKKAPYEKSYSYICDIL